MNSLLPILDTVLYVLLFLAVFYLFLFALYSLRGTKKGIPTARKIHRIAVLLPAYKEDKVIMGPVESLLAQDYPRDMFDIVVISDHMSEATNRQLAAMPVKLLEIHFENSSKAKALNHAVESLRGGGYDVAVILDGDNTVEQNFLREINNAYAAGMKAIQAHRMAKNLDTDTAVLDAVSEEINNSIFRLGHVNMGFSSALIGSGMAFDYKWFEKNIAAATTAGEDKELEVLLLKQGIYIGYLEDVPVYDEKTKKEGAFYNQRRRWLAAQFGMLGRTLGDFPGALFSGNYDYCDKMLQWMMPPRIVLLGLTGLLALSATYVYWVWSLKWWALLLLMLFTLAMAAPDYLIDKRFNRAMRKLPLLGLMMVLNLFRLRGANRKFIHTEHSH